jgi:hypothetical protein
MRTALLTALALTLSAPALSAADVDYLRDVKPILSAHCTTCHSAIRQKSGLRLDAASLIRKGGKHGPALVPGKSGESLLVQAVRGDGRPRMPPESEGAALSDADIITLKNWIDQGAKAPDEPVPDDPRNHWAFRPPVRPAPPRLAAGNPVDAFVAAERARHGLTANPPADRATLLRRVYLDLVGVPPTRDELRAFLADSSPDAYERVVDRLLASPQYGERWGRHWLDVWRYSDPFGLGEEYRYSQRHIWRWRDWVIESLNADKGYDRMIVEMLAGDEVAPADRDTLRATGYLARNWYKYNRNAWLQDTVEHTAAGFLGVTLRCARCHDHKYDPISQQEYYRFRAFFEPHDVRIDPVPGQPDVTKDGVARAYEAQPDAPTFLFVRGDDRNPDKAHPLTPGVPLALGGAARVEPVTFSPRHFAASLDTAAAEALRVTRGELTAAGQGVKAAADGLAAAQQRLEQFAAGAQPKALTPDSWLKDTFTAKQDVWRPVSGMWVWEKGRLAQKQAGSFLTLVTTREHPQDLMGRIRYRTTGGAITSVGISFDVVGTDSWQAIYTCTTPGASAVQAFHRAGGKEVYPSEGIVRTPLKLGEEIKLDFAVRGTLLNVWVNGELKIVYRLPTARRVGHFALWNHEATSEFLEVNLLELPAQVALAEKAGESQPSPLSGPLVVTRADADKAVARARGAGIAAREREERARAALAAVEARVIAERAQYAEPPDPGARSLALAAGKAERHVAALAARQSLRLAEEAVTAARAAATPDKKALADAEQKLTAARKALADAQAAADRDDPTYTPLVVVKPAGSTGRRLALARWVTQRDNPLTARVAVNHVWMRHFGKPLVPTVANFGLNGKKPTHPDLLDWLAVQFMDDGWSMKRLHRLIVTSDTYRLASVSARPLAANLAIDPENHYLWGMSPRRMEAEIVRDSLLAAAGDLDVRQGGPILDEKLGQTSRRRSLYFRFNTEYRMMFLDQFDPASPTECYERRESVVPQQALALINSGLALSESRLLAKRLAAEPDFVSAAFEQVLGRPPTAEERTRCERFLSEQAALVKEPGKLTPFPAGPDAATAPAADPAQRARENLVHVLFNHNDFVTIR